MIKPDSLCQIEIPVKDLGAGARFFQQAFGWETVPAEMHNYVVFDVPKTCPFGVSLVPASNGTPVPSGQRVTIYFAVDAPEDALQRIEGAGGTKSLGPRQIPGYGTIWHFCDPDGNRFGLFQRKPITT